MFSSAKALQSLTQQSDRIAALELEIVELRRQLALSSAPSTDYSNTTTIDGLDPEARYRALLELSPQAVWMADADGRNTYSNRYWYEFSGLTPEQSTGLGWMSIVHPDDVAGTMEEWRKWVAGGAEHEFVMRFRRASDGEYRWHLCHSVPLKDNQGKLVKWLGVAVDVHERRTAAAAIREANQRMVMAVEAAEAGIWDYYPKTGKMEGSARCLAIFGMPQPQGGEATADSFFQSVHHQDRDRIVEVGQKALDPAVAADLDVDFRIVWPGGSVRWVFVKGGCFFSGEGAAREAVRLSGIVVDVTERKEAERERAGLVAALQNSPDFIGIIDLNARTIFINRAGLKMVGLPDAAEARTKTAFDYLYDEERSLVTREVLPLVRAGQVWEGEFRMRHFVTGEPILVETRIFGVYDEAGQLISMANVSRDISEKKKLEERLRLAQKMEAVGRLAGGITHDFNNLLAVIRGAAEVLQKRWSQSQLDLKVVKEISDAAERASSLTEQLLAFGKRQTVRPRPIDLNQVILRMRSVLQRLVGDDIKLDIQLEERLRHVKMDPIQVDQILINLAANARDAIPREDTGMIRIRTFNSDAPPPGLPPGQYVCLSLSDSGRGMDRETLSHIFEPFFTTKEQGKGTGLGLYIVYGIAHQSGGDITVESSLGQGTSFTLHLPCTSEEITADESRPEAGSATGSGAILLVEDEAPLRAIFASYIREYGYTVQEAADAEEALKIARIHDIDLLLTDIAMPGTSGLALATKLASMQPKVQVIFISGNPDHAALEEAHPNSTFLQKPFHLSTLAAKIKEAMESRGRSGESPSSPAI